MSGQVAAGIAQQKKVTCQKNPVPDPEKQAEAEVKMGKCFKKKDRSNDRGNNDKDREQKIHQTESVFHAASVTILKEDIIPFFSAPVHLKDLRFFVATRQAPRGCAFVRRTNGFFSICCNPLFFFAFLKIILAIFLESCNMHLDCLTMWQEFD
jgi:hypothetical protein